MRRLEFALVLAGALVAFLAVASSARASTGVMTITTDTVLTEDHHGPIGFAADGVTLDCAGHLVTGPAPAGVGVTVVGRTNVTIRRCRIDGVPYGFAGMWDSSTTFVGNTITGSNTVAIYLNGSRDGTFSHNVMIGNHLGLWATGSEFGVIRSFSSNVISGNTAIGTDLDGFTLGKTGPGASSNEIVANVARDSGGTGFSFSNGNSNTVTRNSSVGNGGSGYVLAADFAANALVANIGVANGQSGFVVGGSGNSVARNVAAFNGAYGFLASLGAVTNTFKANAAGWNTSYDARDENAPHANQWLGNLFRTTAGI